MTCILLPDMDNCQMNSAYEDFLARKAVTDPATGLASVPALNPMLFDFQRDIVRWALRRGRAAIFADCGMGKTPLQLEVIRRCVRLWSNPGDLVFSPFAGIGSEGYVALQMGRRFVGSELKRSYWEQACRNLAQAKQSQGGLLLADPTAIPA